VARVGSSGGLPVLPSPDAMASMGIVGDGTGVLQVDSSSPFSHNYGGGLPSPSSARAQLQQHVQNMQLQQQVFAPINARTDMILDVMPASSQSL
jgi:hypothetical protein